MSRLVDKRDLPIFIHSTIDDMTDLSPNAMRVYMHLARRANKDGVAWPSYQSIGDHCFKSVSANASTRKSFARKAIDDLIAAGLVVKTHRVDEHGEHSSNAYQLVNPPMPNNTGMPIDTGVPNKHTPMPIDTPMPNRHQRYSTEDTPSESAPLKTTEDEEEKRPPHAAVIRAWQQNIPGTLTEILGAKLTDLIDECGEPAVMHGIVASVEAGVRNFRYVAACARNHAAGKEPPAKVPPPSRRAAPVSKVAGSMAAVDEIEAMLREGKL